MPALYLHSAVVNASTSTQVFLFGGLTEGDQHPSNDVYAWVSGDFIKVNVTGARPQPRADHGAVLYQDHMIVHGGFHVSEFELQGLSDTWSFSVRTNRWTQLQVANAVPRGAFTAMFVSQPTPRLVIAWGYDTGSLGPIGLYIPKPSMSLPLIELASCLKFIDNTNPGIAFLDLDQLALDGSASNVCIQPRVARQLTGQASFQTLPRLIEDTTVVSGALFLPLDDSSLLLFSGFTALFGQQVPSDHVYIAG